MEDVPWLDRPQLAAWVRVVSLLELLPADLDGQLRREGGVTLFEYFVLAMLSEAPEHTLRMSELAAQTNSTLPRLSHVVRRLEDRGLVTRAPRPGDRRSTDARLTDQGVAQLEAAAPRHVVHVRRQVIDALSPDQISQLTTIADALLARLDPDGSMAATYHRYDQAPPL